MATRAIVGEKVGMTQVWDDDNRVVPVTVLKVSAARIVQVKTTVATTQAASGRNPQLLCEGDTSCRSGTRVAGFGRNQASP